MLMMNADKFCFILRDFGIISMGHLNEAARLTDSRHYSSERLFQLIAVAILRSELLGSGASQLHCEVGGLSLRSHRSLHCHPEDSQRILLLQGVAWLLTNISRISILYLWAHVSLDP